MGEGICHGGVVAWAKACREARTGQDQELESDKVTGEAGQTEKLLNKYLSND